MELNKLLRPQKIVIVGATERETMAGFASRMFLEQCRERMEDLYLVSLKNDRVFGVPCYRKISDIPGKIDLAVICTPKTTVPALLEEAAEQGAKGAVVFASGYGETKLPEDVRMEEELTAKAKDLDIAVMGPNCAGFLNFVDRVFAFGFLFQARESAGKIGLVSQSGQVCMGLMESAKGSFSYVISAGNSKIVTMEDYLEFLVEDENTEVVAAYMEGIKKPEKFAQVLHRAVEKRKPVVILKAGRSQKGSRAAASHTGNLSGCDKHTDALFKKFGVIRVEDLEELLSVCAAIVTLPKLPEKKQSGICKYIRRGDNNLSGRRFPVRSGTS
ncbi:CoA-binding protein [Blautia sp. NSJ-175]|uniref:CoA-binding protein n=1 Tax=Blautia sp. NSJ-175 TaxID=2931396 RepID=UPI001FD11BFD|nr:CoA-binding protein [Blautia sp. NSJ-175]MCJ7846109.1 CoA-binding protein [Blautia sp. NSJ-175]